MPRLCGALLLLLLLTEPSAADSRTVLQQSLLDIYRILKYGLMSLSVISVIAIAIHGFSGRFAWGWLTSLGVSAALLLLAPYIIEAATGAQPIEIASNSAESAWSSWDNDGTMPPPLQDSTPPSQQPGNQPEPSETVPPLTSYQAQRMAAITAHCYAHYTQLQEREHCMSWPWQHNHDEGYLHIDRVWTPLCRVLSWICTAPPHIPFRYLLSVYP